MPARIPSSTVIGIDAHPVDVEVDISRGLPAYTTVGLPEAAVRESKERVKSAINNSGYTFPDDRITVNLAPADIKKEGTGFDLPIALGLMAAMRIISQDVINGFPVMGELSLDGRIKPVKGTLPMALAAKNIGYDKIIVPYDNRLEAAVVRGIEVYAAKNLSQVIAFIRGEAAIEPVKVNPSDIFNRQLVTTFDFFEVMGQEHVKRAVEVAAAGGHNMVMLGPPGSGKTMMARRIPTILPSISFQEAIETTKIYSIMGMLKSDQSLVTHRPFRSPHHTISDAGLIGGGQIPRPGEVSLAHNGVLFLDELAEYRKNVLESLRQPLEDGQVTISRAAMALTYPCNIMLVAAMNPCPCGFLTDEKHECHCTPQQIQRYRARISGPLLDRIDIHVEVPAVPYKDLREVGRAEASKAIRQRVESARKIQSGRFENEPIYCNARMQNSHLRKFCKVDAESDRLLEAAVDKLGLSARAHNRVLKIARTIADLENSDKIDISHVSEAVQYRTLDRV